MTARGGGSGLAITQPRQLERLEARTVVEGYMHQRLAALLLSTAQSGERARSGARCLLEWRSGKFG
jgi:hypothetical protein